MSRGTSEGQCGHTWTYRGLPFSCAWPAGHGGAHVSADMPRLPAEGPCVVGDECEASHRCAVHAGQERRETMTGRLWREKEERDTADGPPERTGAADGSTYCCLVNEGRVWLCGHAECTCTCGEDMAAESCTWCVAQEEARIGVRAPASAPTEDYELGYGLGRIDGIRAERDRASASVSRGVTCPDGTEPDEPSDRGFVCEHEHEAAALREQLSVYDAKYLDDTHRRSSNASPDEMAKALSYVPEEFIVAGEPPSDAVLRLASTYANRKADADERETGSAPHDDRPARIRLYADALTATTCWTKTSATFAMNDWRDKLRAVLDEEAPCAPPAFEHCKGCLATPLDAWQCPSRGCKMLDETHDRPAVRSGPNASSDPLDERMPIADVDRELRARCRSDEARGASVDVRQRLPMRLRYGDSSHRQPRRSRE